MSHARFTFSLVLACAVFGASATVLAQAAGDQDRAQDDAAAVDEVGHHHGHHGRRGMKGMPLCMPKALIAEMTPYDTDQNGYLDPDEMRAMRAAKRSERLALFDKDGDGRLSAEERVAVRHERRVSRFDSVDENRDGAISRAEAEASCTPLAWRFDKLDADHSGAVEWAEFEAAGLEREQRRQRHKRHKRGGHGKRGARAHW